MLDVINAFFAQYSWLLAGWLSFAFLATFTIRQWRELRHSNWRLHTALNNMSQGLCMWSPAGTLIVCNERYVQMYNLSPELTRPGASLRELIDHRIKVGTFSGNRDQYIAEDEEIMYTEDAIGESPTLQTAIANEWLVRVEKPQEKV